MDEGAVQCSLSVTRACVLYFHFGVVVLSK